MTDGDPGLHRVERHDSAGTPDVAALFYRYHRTMRRVAASVAVRYGLDPENADDAVDTVFERLCRRMPQPSPQEWEAYLVRAAVNAIKDQLKEFSRRRDKPDAEADVRETQDAPADSPPVDEEVATALDHLELVDRVHAAIDRLPPAQRTAVVETYLHERTNIDVGAEMGLSAARVSQLRSAGVRALAQDLGGDLPHAQP